MSKFHLASIVDVDGLLLRSFILVVTESTGNCTYLLLHSYKLCTNLQDTASFLLYTAS